MWFYHDSTSKPGFHYAIPYVPRAILCLVSLSHVHGYVTPKTIVLLPSLSLSRWCTLQSNQKQQNFPIKQIYQNMELACIDGFLKFCHLWIGSVSQLSISIQAAKESYMRSSTDIHPFQYMSIDCLDIKICCRI